MPDQFTKTTSRSWIQRIVGSLIGALVGLGLFLASFVLFTWNEGRSIRRIQSLEEGKEIVQSISSDKIDRSKQGALVYTIGNVVAEKPVHDELFDIEGPFLKLRRTVEMLQWKEQSQSKTEKKLGGKEETQTTYTYTQTWSSKRIPSEQFQKTQGHENPKSMEYQTRYFASPKITFGRFFLTPEFLEQIQSYRDLPLQSSDYEKLDPSLKSIFSVRNGNYYTGNPQSPSIGDYRVQFSVIDSKEVSVVGKQNGAIIEPFQTRSGALSLLQEGTVGVEQMFEKAHRDNTGLTWLIRLGGLIMMWFGLALILGPLKTFGDVVPFIGSLLGAGIVLCTGLISIALSLITISIAWLVYRPTLGLSLLLIAGFSIWMLITHTKRKNLQA